MWFDPGELTKTKNSTLATFATPATLEEENNKRVTQSRKVAKVAAPLNSKNDTQRNTIKPKDRQMLIDYMAAIGEIDDAIIDALLTKCACDADALAWALGWANKLLSLSRQSKSKAVTCRNCAYFRCYNAHGHGAGQCAIGVWSAGYCRWSDDWHQCNQYSAER